MSERHDDNDGSDIFWPGYVDATTNLILNLLFLLTILIVAVFMFALELGRSSPIEQEKLPIAAVEQDVDVAATTAGLLPAATAETGGLYEAATSEVGDPALENMVLRQEIERLKRLLDQKIANDAQFGGGSAKTMAATGVVPTPQYGLDKALTSDYEVMIRFKDESVEFTPEERDQLIESLTALVATGKASIYVEVPDGFSEAKRMGFYRAMSVRNLLIEMNLPPETINVSVVESKNKVNASVVKVQSH